MFTSHLWRQKSVAKIPPHYVISFPSYHHNHGLTTRSVQQCVIWSRWLEISLSIINELVNGSLSWQSGWTEFIDLVDVLNEFFFSSSSFSLPLTILVTTGEVNGRRHLSHHDNWWMDHCLSYSMWSCCMSYPMSLARLWVMHCNPLVW